MSSRSCRKCGAVLPLAEGRGARRVMCESCSPPKPKPKPKPAVPERLRSLSAAVASGQVRGLVDATLAELDAAGVRSSSSGQAALLLARRIESGAEKGAGLASLVKQHRESVAAALAPAAAPVADPLDELRRRRAAQG